MSEDRGPGWLYADVWEAISDRYPDAPAQVHGDRRFTWAEFDRRADSLAAELVGADLGPQEKVAQYLLNGPEYVESIYACFKAGLVPVNVNHRYTTSELVYLLTDSDTAAVVFHADFTGPCEEIRCDLPKVRAWFWVATPDSDDECPDWAVPYEVATQQVQSRFRAPWGRSPDDLFLLYTGGTTGFPKGVMWPQSELFAMLAQSSGVRLPADADATRYAESLDRLGPRVLPAAPLMHGTAAWFGMNALSRAGCLVNVPSRKFQPVETLDTLSAERINGVAIVGEPFARPLLASLDATPERWDLSSLRVIFSSGVMMSPATKQALLEHCTRAVVVDGLGTSESGALGRHVTDRGKRSVTGDFVAGPNVTILDDTNRPLRPGTGQPGRLAVGGHIPLGYYNDLEKTAATFVTVDGRRYVVAGDWATIDADGIIGLLGRGSVCINTGGEKVFAEEVEEAIKSHQSVADAVVVALPDDRFVEVVGAVVQPVAGESLDSAALVAHVRTLLAAYKAPKHVVQVDDIGRSASGKADYERLKQLAVSDRDARCSDIS